MIHQATNHKPAGQSLFKPCPQAFLVCFQVSISFIRVSLLHQDDRWCIASKYVNCRVHLPGSHGRKSYVFNESLTKLKGERGVLPGEWNLPPFSLPQGSLQIGWVTEWGTLGWVGTHWCNSVLFCYDECYLNMFGEEQPTVNLLNLFSLNSSQSEAPSTCVDWSSQWGCLTHCD